MRYHYRYINYSKILNKVIMCGKYNYYAKGFNENKGNVKKSWELINGIIKRKGCDKSDSNDDIAIDIGNQRINNLKQIVNSFNTWFSNIPKSSFVGNFVDREDRNVNTCFFN